MARRGEAIREYRKEETEREISGMETGRNKGRQKALE